MEYYNCNKNRTGKRREKKRKEEKRREEKRREEKRQVMCCYCLMVKQSTVNACI
jgi:hypothetical protein